MGKDGIQGEKVQEFDHQKMDNRKLNFFKIQGEKIPTVSEDHIKCLGKWYDGSLVVTPRMRGNSSTTSRTTKPDRVQKHTRKI